MKLNNVALIAGLGLGGYLLYKKLYGLNQVSQQANIQFLGFDTFNWNAFNSGINLKIRVNNPVNQDVKLLSLTGDVIVSGEAVGKINYLTPQVFKGLSSTDVTIPVTISTTGVIDKLMDLLKGKFAVGANIKGTANFDFGSIPFNQTIVS